MKICNKCDVSKNLDLFYNNKNSKDGLTSSCKECISNKNKSDYLNNKENILMKSKKYRSEKKETFKDYQKIYRNKTKEKYKEYHKKYNKQYWENNRDKRAQYDKNYLKKYPHVRSYRNSLKSCLERMGMEKINSSFELLGYTPQEFKIHIESLFLEGMSWENRSEWHIDHIKPVSLFDQNKPIYIVNALNNLQPIWAIDNLSKSNNYNGNK